MNARRLVALALTMLFVVGVSPWPPPPAPRAQGVEVFVNVTGGGARKLNIAIPDFTVVAGSDVGGGGKVLATVAGADLTFSGLFSVVAAAGTIPANNPAALRESWTAFAAAGAHAGLHGLLSLRGERAEAEMRLYDLTTPEHRLIASKKFELSTGQLRRLAHKIADEIVLQFTGELGVADTKIAYVAGPVGAKELAMSDYDGFGATPVTRNGSINMTPVWSPDARSLAFTSYRNGYPDLFRAFPFERRPEQTLAAFSGINSSPAFNPEGKSLAMTLSKDGNPEIYLLTLATGALRRLTNNAGIDTEPSWSPRGDQLAFVSDRGGRPAIHIMDSSGGNVRQLTSGGFHTQPRWSPKGDTIAYTQRAGTHDIWLINVDGSNPRALTTGWGESQSATWAPNGRHLAFQTSRGGRWQIYAMLADGSQQEPITRGAGEFASPAWSPRMP